MFNKNLDNKRKSRLYNFIFGRKSGGNKVLAKRLYYVQSNICMCHILGILLDKRH